MTEQTTTVTQCPKFAWCVMGHAHKGQCSSAHYTLTEVVEPRVEAGDRALETAREIAGPLPALAVDSSGAYEDFVNQCATLIQSAMNAQERELRATLRQFISQVELATLTDNDRFMFENTVRDAERLLAERGGAK